MMADEDDCCCGCCVGLAIGLVLSGGVKISFADTGETSLSLEQTVISEKQDRESIENKNILLKGIGYYQEQISPQIKEKLGKEKDNIIIEGKIAFHFIPHSIKLFITASDDVRATRIFNDKNWRNQEKPENVEEQKKLNAERIDIDNVRYKKYYDIDYSDMTQYDFVLDTTDELDIEKNVDKIMEFLNSRE